MPTYRKKPVEVDIYRLGAGFEQPQWLLNAIANGTVALLADGTQAMVHTLEGALLSTPYAVLIRGPYGEIYPCRADIFINTYTEVPDPLVVPLAATSEGPTAEDPTTEVPA